ncbi:MAG: 4'-phosphopantetheinyl transferase superfamily protein [Gemmatimonadota bacterium]|nr:4'-phosphopantetheinyl transferase superfamily protein [Gemmatimonadota bacterium]
MRWIRPDRTPSLDPSEIHVWRIRLKAAWDPERSEEALSDGEKRRAERFRFELHRRRWSAAQTSLRSILATYLDRAAGDIDFDRGPHGKPYLAAEVEGRDLRFNLTHSADLALLAVTRGREVGIDLERMRRDRPVADLARRWFAPEEAEAVLAMPSGERSSGFFACWTRKEAVIKAEGLTVPAALKRFTVPVGPIDEAIVAEGPERTWSLASLPAATGFAAAIAYEGPAARTRGFLWPS